MDNATLRIAIMVLIAVVTGYRLWRSRQADAPAQVPSTPSKPDVEAAGSSGPVITMRSSKTPRPPSPEGPLSQGWIWVGESVDFPAEVRAHQELTTPEVPREVPVAICTLEEGFVLRFPDGVPAYALTNLIAWLGAHTRQVQGSIVSPATGVTYTLTPAGDALGELLAGWGDNGCKVQVYLPDGTLTVVGPEDDPEPRDVSGAVEVERFTITVDVGGFGNPEFVAS